MAIRDKYFPGSTVSRYLPPGERSWDEAVYQSGKPVLDSELNLSQEVGKEIRRLLQRHEVPSGWVRGPVGPAHDDYSFPAVGSAFFNANSFYMRRRTAVVANMPVTVEYTNTDVDVVTVPGSAPAGGNRIDLEPAPVNGGTSPDIKRTDFVFLEVWRAQISHSPRATNYLTVTSLGAVAPGDTVDIKGTILTATNVGPAADEFLIGASESQTAANIAAALNLATNSFTGLVTAQVDAAVPEQVNMYAADAFAGAAGNGPAGLTLTVTSGGITAFSANFSGGADTPNKPTQASIYRHGNVLAPASVNLPDDLADPVVGTESTKRVQVQYRMRASGQAENVDRATTNGFIGANWIRTSGVVPVSADSLVEAQGAQPSPVGRYRFVPADGQTVLAYIEITGAAPVLVGDSIVVNGITLSAASPAVNPDEFDPTGGPAATAAGIAAALTAVVPTVAASASGSLVTLIPAALGGDIRIAETVANPASMTTAVNSAVSYDTTDSGLYVAGDGTEAAANALGTVDGFVYAIPAAFVFRRNDASGTGGFDPINNTNGALAHDHVGFSNTHIDSGAATPIGGGVSDRPDRRFHDVVVAGDVLDLRRQVSPGGVDLKAELHSQMTALLDGTLFTWAIDTADVTTLGSGSGDVSTQYLVCNEIGDQDTNRGETIGQWDHIRRRFGDQSVVERRVFPLLPTSDVASNPGLYADPAVADWRTGTVLHVDLDSLDASGLGDWVPTGSPAVVSGQWPAGTTITNVLRVVHDDGHNPTAIDQTVEIDLVVGVGTPHVEITLASNNLSANGGVFGSASYPLVDAATGSPRRIFVELEITYPTGAGLSATPDVEVFGDSSVTPYHGAALENDKSKRPVDWEDLQRPAFRPGYREVLMEYVCNDGSGVGSGAPVVDQVVGNNFTSMVLPRRFYGVKGMVPAGMSVTDVGGPGPAANLTLDTAATTWANSERKIVTVDPTQGSQSLCTVQYFPQDPIPDYSSPGDRYQISVYYRSNAPQTCGVVAGSPATSPMPETLSLKPLVMSHDLWSGTVSSGSLDLPFPYSNPSDQIAVNEDLQSGPNPDFPGEWALSSLAKISVGDFDANTGLLNLHQQVPVDPNSPFTFSGRGQDSEFRLHYKMADTGAYRPTAMAQPLSGVATHKVWLPFLAEAAEDNVYFRRGEVVLVVVSRYALLDGENVVRFVDGGTDTCAAVYRTRGLLLLASEQ